MSGNPRWLAPVFWCAGGLARGRSAPATCGQGFASFEFLAGIAALRPPLTIISTECHPRGRTGVSDGATRARSSCSQRCNSKFTVALRRWKTPRKTGVALCRLSRVCGSAMDNSVAFVLKDCATSRSGHSALQNVTFGCVSVKSRKSKSGDNSWRCSVRARYFTPFARALPHTRTRTVQRTRFDARADPSVTAL